MQEKVGKSKARMVRKQLLLPPDLNARLKSHAAATRRPESELLREALAAWLASQQEQADDWKASWRQAAGLWKDRTDLDELFPSLRASWDRHSGIDQPAPKRRR